jgi:hypothetical protein
VIARRDEAAAAADSAAAAPAGDDEGDDGEAAGPLAIAIDVAPEAAAIEADPLATAPA